MHNALAQFLDESLKNSRAMSNHCDIKALAQQLIQFMTEYRYSYNFYWMGRPIIQIPQDIMAMQEIIWSVKPDLIIETGVAHGGALVFYASMLELLGGDRLAIGVEQDLRPHNRQEIENHPMSKRIKLIEGSSIENSTISCLKLIASNYNKVLVCLDSNHTHNHVLQELNLYAPLVSKGSYLVVFDTIVEQLKDDASSNRPWGIDNNPMTAVREFLKNNDRFIIDKNIDNKILISFSPSGYLKCIKD